MTTTDLSTRIAALEAAAKAAGMLDERGEVRKVMGTLPVTKDGAVLGNGARVYHDGSLSYYSRELTAAKILWQDDGPVACVESDTCYSTREAAIAARDRDPNGPGGGE